MAANPRAPKARRRTFLKAWRKYRGLNQTQAAERLDITQGTLSRIENGTLPYSQDFLEAAAYAYMCEPADLLMRDPTKTDAVWHISENLRKATPEQHARIQAVIDALLKDAS